MGDKPAFIQRCQRSNKRSNRSARRVGKKAQSGGSSTKAGCPVYEQARKGSSKHSAIQKTQAQITDMSSVLAKGKVMAREDLGADSGAITFPLASTLLMSVI